VTDDLAYDSPDGRELFLIALREFSESCRPPELIAACPFSIETEAGVRSCGEECFDILGANNAGAPITDVVLDGGLTVQRRVLPRSRRGSVGLSRPFDAKEIFQEDSGAGEPPRWRLAALIYGLDDLVTTAPPVDSDSAQIRLSRITDLIELIEARGLDVEKHLEHSLRRRTVPVLMGALRHPVLRQEPAEFANGDEWVDLLDLGEDSDVKTLQLTALQTVITWTQGASRDDLLNCNPPDNVAEGFPPRAGPDAAREVGEWMVDRFCTTYISEWSDVSLRQEWEYLHGSLMPPCPSTEMSVRVVAEDEIARVMAERFAKPKGADPTQLPVPDLVEPAAALLEEGRSAEAEALFEALLQMNPSNAATHNNLGFCILPDQPVRAIGHFEEATKLDPDFDLAKLNRILALALVGKRDEAIDSAIRFREETDEGFTQATGWLWNLDSILLEREPFIDKEVNFGSYLDEIVHSLEGDQERNPASEG